MSENADLKRKLLATMTEHFRQNVDASRFDGKVYYDEAFDAFMLREGDGSPEFVALIEIIIDDEHGFVPKMFSGDNPAIHVYDERLMQWAKDFKPVLEKFSASEGTPIEVDVVQQYT